MALEFETRERERVGALQAERKAANQAAQAANAIARGKGPVEYYESEYDTGVTIVEDTPKPKKSRKSKKKED